MPRDADALRVLARATGLSSSADELTEHWQSTKLAVRSLHERLFYRPLLSAVAALPDDELSLSSEQAVARLAAIGFANPTGALQHIAALTGGVSRRATIQRTLLPVMLQWFADGADPDYGLLAFRRLSDDLGEAYWFLRMLRDSSGAAQRLTSVLSGSRFVGDLFERIPEAAAWLENDEELRPRPLPLLLEEARATVARHDDDRMPRPARCAPPAAARCCALALGRHPRAHHRRGARAGPQRHRRLHSLTGVLALVRRDRDGIEFGIIAMGRYGGEELGFGSDADIMYVYRAAGSDAEEAQRAAEQIVHSLKRLIGGPAPAARPRRRAAPRGQERRDRALARLATAPTTSAGRSPGRRRRCCAPAEPRATQALLRDFEALADEVRYPADIGEKDVREVKRIKARVEIGAAAAGRRPVAAPQARVAAR